jgi:hypothetical protein
VLEQPEDQYGDHKALGFAEEFLKRKHVKPFFLAVGIWHPHIPMYSPKNYWNLYPDDKVKLPETREHDLDDVPPMGKKFAAFRRDELNRIIKEGKQKEFVHAYLAAISFADALAGACLMPWKAVRTRRIRLWCCGPITAGTWARNSTCTSLRCGSVRRTCL